MTEASEKRRVRQRHLARSIRSQRHTRVRSRQLDVRSADDRHFDLVIGAHDKLRERRAERNLPRRRRARRRADHVLLGDFAFQILRRELLGEPLGMRRVLHVRIEAHHPLIRLTQRNQRRPICLSWSDTFSRGKILVQSHRCQSVGKRLDLDRLYFDRRRLCR